MSAPRDSSNNIQHYCEQYLDNKFDQGGFLISDSDLTKALNTMGNIGAVSLPLISPDDAENLAQEALKLDFRKGQKKVGDGDKTVFQDFQIALNFEQHTELDFFTSAFERKINRALALFPTPPCSYPLHFNDRAAQIYEPGSTGISPHRDLIIFESVIAIITLRGQADFFICDDRQKTNSIKFEAQPGSMILMRGMNYNNNAHRPFHYVENIPHQRIGFGLRFNAKI